MLPPDFQRLEHIRDYCDRVQRSVLRHGNSFEEFRTDEEFQQSVAFCILQIGELGGKLSPEYRRATSSRIPWNLIKGMRNLVVHEYGRIDQRTLWGTAVKDIPELRQFCQEQLSSGEELEEP